MATAGMRDLVDRPKRPQTLDLVRNGRRGDVQAAEQVCTAPAVDTTHASCTRSRLRSRSGSEIVEVEDAKAARRQLVRPSAGMRLAACR